MTQTDGSPQQVVLSLSGWKLNYLFRSDRLVVDIALNPADYLYIEADNNFGPFIEDYMQTSVSYYDVKENVVSWGSFSFNKDLSVCILDLQRAAGKLLVASTDKDADLTQIAALYGKNN